MRWLDGITDSMEMRLSKPQETVTDREDKFNIVWFLGSSESDKGEKQVIMENC